MLLDVLLVVAVDVLSVRFPGEISCRLCFHEDSCLLSKH